MFRLLVNIPRKIYIAVSGGADSMAVLNFLKSNHDVTVVHFNHGTDHGREAEAFVRLYVKKNNIPAIFGKIDEEIPKGVSKEDFWRKKRYAFFDAIVGCNKLILAHNLDDAVETWLFGSIHGHAGIIPINNGYIMRPFLLVKKQELREWCKRKGIPFVDDPANDDVSYPRVRLRKVIIPEILKINPGIYKVVAKKYLEQ